MGHGLWSAGDGSWALDHWLMKDVSVPRPMAYESCPMAHATIWGFFSLEWVSSLIWLLGLRFRELGASILVFWETTLALRAHPGRPFLHLGATLEDHGSSDGLEVVDNMIFGDLGMI